MSRVKIQVQCILNRVAGYIPNEMKNSFPLYSRESKYVITHFWEAHTIEHLSHSLPFGGQHYQVYTAYLGHRGRYSSLMGQHAARVMDHQSIIIMR